jgi:hypothetical protein
MYAALTGRTPIGAPALIKGRPTIDTGPEQETVVDSSLRIPLVDLRDATAAELQEIAWKVFSQQRTTN